MENIAQIGSSLVGIIATFVLGILSHRIKKHIDSVEQNTLAIAKLTAHVEFLEKKTDFLPKFQKDMDEAHNKLRNIELVLAQGDLL